MGRKGLLFLLLIGHAVSQLYAQTSVEGIINSDSVFNIEYSPYLVTKDLVITPDGKLTIEAGVEVFFVENTQLEVRGTLIAEGNKNDSIFFIPNDNTELGSWEGISIKNTQGGNAIFKYCVFLYASNAINEECCGGDTASVTVGNSAFRFNKVAIGGYSGNETLIDSCSFTFNESAIIQADKLIKNSYFSNNNYGLNATERVNIYNCIFRNHSIAALYGGRGYVSACVISDNAIGVESLYEGFTLKNNIISNNDTGLIIYDYDGYIASVDSNKICENSVFNVQNRSLYNAYLYNNCWCLNDSASIDEKIYDGLDNTKLGLVSFDIYNQSCDSILKKVNKTQGKINIWSKANSPYIIEEDFKLNVNDTLIIEPGVVVKFADSVSLEIQGTLLALGSRNDSIIFTSNTDSSKLWSGIAIKNTLGGNAQFKFCKFYYASTAISEECCWGGKVVIGNSAFISNLVAIGGYSGDLAVIDSCLFKGNTYCITGADKEISHSIFKDNNYGLYTTERVNVVKCSFEGNTGAALYGGRGKVVECEIISNAIGIKNYFEGFSVFNSNISKNEIGLELQDYDGYIAPVVQSKISNNSSFNVINKSIYNVDLSKNCWSVADSAQIENLIYDGYDDKRLGLISYNVFNTNCDTVILSVDKTRSYNNHWTIENSPYIITEDYVVFQGDSLIIDPGVEVRLADSVKIEVRGTIMAQGLENDTILFTSIHKKKKGWLGIVIQNQLGGNAEFSYCKFQYAESAIYEGCCWDGQVKISHCTFVSNHIGIGGYSGEITPVDDSYFYDHYIAVSGADKQFNNCIFESNKYGFFQTERVSASNSTFTDHELVALSGGRGLLKNVDVTDNKIGIRSNFEGFTIKNSNISNNEIGIVLNDYDGTFGAIDSNTICSNKEYNIKNTSSYNVALYNNCWCNEDSTTVEDKIYDGWDDSSRGLVDYTLFTNDCMFSIFKSVKLKNLVIYSDSESIPTNVENVESKEIIYYPNPASGSVKVIMNNEMEAVWFINTMGQAVGYAKLSGNDQIVSLDGLKPGIYMLRFKLRNGSFIVKKLSIVQ